MAKFGLDYETLKAANPSLIYCSLTGYGQTGPLKNRAGHDINYLARSGISSYSGRKASGPCLMGIQIADVASGSNNAVIGILAAVVHRQRTGEGQHVDVSMTDGVDRLQRPCRRRVSRGRNGDPPRGGGPERRLALRLLRNEGREVPQLRRPGAPVLRRLLRDDRPPRPDPRRCRSPGSHPHQGGGPRRS